MAAGVREQRLLTRWKQPCVIWEASKLTHLVRLARPPVAALTLPILRRSCPLASCAWKLHDHKEQETQVVCAAQQRRYLSFVILKQVQDDDEDWTKSATSY